MMYKSFFENFIKDQNKHFIMLLVECLLITEKTVLEYERSLFGSGILLDIIVIYYRIF